MAMNFNVALGFLLLYISNSRYPMMRASVAAIEQYCTSIHFDMLHASALN